MFLRLSLCFCAIGCQHSIFNRLFGCFFLVWRHHLRKVNKSSVRTFRCFFLQFSFIFDVPQYSNRLDYIKYIRPAIYSNNQKNCCISSLNLFATVKYSTWKLKKSMMSSTVLLINKHSSEEISDKCSGLEGWQMTWKSLARKWKKSLLNDLIRKLYKTGSTHQALGIDHPRCVWTHENIKVV